MKTAVLIPARLESTRLPGKALKNIEGLPAIVHVYKRSTLAKNVDDVYVVTDSIEIKKAVEEHDGKVILTKKHKNGSERIYEASHNIDAEFIINVQGDEVLVYPEHIEKIAESIKSNSSANYVLGVTPFSKENSPQDFKAVLDLNNNLMYCSRSDIPSSSVNNDNSRLKVVFIVGFTKKSLSMFVNWEETPLEKREPNEFLRILENGEKIKAVFLSSAKISLDTIDDLHEIRTLMKSDNLYKKEYC